MNLTFGKVVKSLVLNKILCAAVAVISVLLLFTLPGSGIKAKAIIQTPGETVVVKEPESESEKNVEAQKLDIVLTLGYDEVTLFAHEKLKLKVYQSTPTDDMIKWESSNSDIASVDDDGRIMTFSEGTAYIKASLGEAYATCRVNVTSSEDLYTSEAGSFEEKAYYLGVDKARNTVSVFDKDENGEYTVLVRRMICSTGIATPKGSSYKLTGKRKRWCSLYGGTSGQYSVQIRGDILFHSVPYAKRSLDALVIKYYNELGTAASAGCVRLRTVDAKWIYDYCSRDAFVDFTYSDPIKEMPTALKLTGARGWDPTDPSENNPWREKSASVTVGELRLTLGENTENFKEYIYDILKLCDVDGSELTARDISSRIAVGCLPDIECAGVYKLRVSFTDACGNENVAFASVRVEKVFPEAVEVAGIYKLKVGERLPLNVTLVGEATEKSFTAASSDIGVFEVSDDGELYARNVGTAKLIVNTQNGLYTEALVVVAD